MTRLVYSNAFIEDMLTVELASKRDEILSKTDFLSEFPNLGSANIPASIRSRYGDSVRKLVVDPFDVIYAYDQKLETVYILGLIHQRASY